jgi:dipeptidyl aminopeptidase/acylaminoacyl peptidase
LNGYLTLPLNKKPKMLPTILLVHGGPWVRDEWGYSIAGQLFANRGYAVLQINYRGSTGYGRKFWQASFKQWGRAMQNDLTDGVNWLIEKGIANPKKIAIRGSSYGGYAVLSGLTMTPDLYACGVDSYGISNIFTFIKSIPPYWKPYLKTVYEMIGHPVKDRKLLRDISPLFHIDKIKSPLMISQGKRDVRVNFKESEQIVSKLKEKGRPVIYEIYENEGHGYWNEKNVLKSYKVVINFLKKYLG